ncbi:MAG TPA: hypothetical protein VNA69_06665 [Thermoanaerobaculia bacterium]|nr:hypothetical protein [Thermoanaerobaculia bacterium]
MKRFLASLIAFVLAGCAGMHVTKIGADTDFTSSGIRYYGSSPYIYVTTDNAGGLTPTLVYLPDPKKKMSAYLYNIVSTNDATLEFENGMLKTSEITADSAVLPKAVISALEKIAVAALARNEAKDPPNVPLPYIFKVLFDVDGMPYLIDKDGPIDAGSLGGLHATKGD